MRLSDKINCFFHCHIIIVDIACPYIADSLFTFQIILRYTFHGYGSVFKVFNLPLVRISVFQPRVKNYENQYGNHDDYINYNYINLFHALSSISEFIHSPPATCFESKRNCLLFKILLSISLNTYDFFSQKQINCINMVYTFLLILEIIQRNNISWITVLDKSEWSILTLLQFLCRLKISGLQ